jgi:uncharacterized membrane protein
LQLFDFAADERNMGTERGELMRGATTDAAAATRDDDALALEIKASRAAASISRTRCSRGNRVTVCLAPSAISDVSSASSARTDHMNPAFTECRSRLLLLSDTHCGTLP